MFQAALPDSLTDAPRFFSLDNVKIEFMEHWTRLAKERFLAGLLECFEEYPALTSVKFYVDDGIDLVDELKPRIGRYRLSIDFWHWQYEPDPPVLMTDIETRLEKVFSDELAKFMAESFDRESVDQALARLAASHKPVHCA